MKTIMFFAYTSVFNSKIYASIQNLTDDGDCLADFQLNNGICEPCYGSWGTECTQNCSLGYYGFGCRSKCNCHPDQSCDTRVGCIENLSKDEDFDESASPLHDNTLLAISICTGSLCLILIFYILCKRYNINQKQKSTAIDLKEQVNVTLDVEPPTSSHHGCHSQNTGSLTGIHTSSLCRTTIHANLSPPNRKTDNLYKSDTSISQESPKNSHQLSGTLSVYNHFYYKCELGCDDYDHIETIQDHYQKKSSKAMHCEVNERIYHP